MQISLKKHLKTSEELQKTGRACLISLFVLLSLIPFNFFRFIQISIGPWRLPFYYIVLGCIALGAFSVSLLVKPTVSLKTFLVILLVALPPILSMAIKLREAGINHSVVAFIFLGPMTLFSTVQCFKRIETVFWAAGLLLAAGLIVSGLGILESSAHRNILYHQFFLAHDFYYREVLPVRGGVASTIGHALPLGAYLVLILPLPFAFREQLGDSISLLCVAMIFVCILMTLTRSSWIAGILVLLGIFLAMKKSRRMVLTTIGVSLLLFLFASQFLARVVNRRGDTPDVTFFYLITQRLNPRALAAEILHSPRTEHYQVSLQVLRLHPWMGVGYGNYQEAYNGLSVTTAARGDPWNIATPDNQFLRWVVENGVLGFLSLLIAGAWFFKRAIDAQRKSPREAPKDLLFSFSLGAGGFLTNLFALDGFVWLTLNFTFSFIIGLALSCIEICEARITSQRLT